MSYRVVVKAKGETQFVGNAIRFDTESEAKAYGKDLESRWMAVSEWKVEASDDPVTHKIIGQAAVSVGGESPVTVKPQQENKEVKVKKSAGVLLHTHFVADGDNFVKFNLAKCHYCGGNQFENLDSKKCGKTREELVALGMVEVPERLPKIGVTGPKAESICPACLAKAAEVAGETKVKAEKEAVKESEAIVKVAGSAEPWDTFSKAQKLAILKEAVLFPGNCNKTWAEITPKLYDRLRAHFPAAIPAKAEIKVATAKASIKARAEDEEGTKALKVDAAELAKSAATMKAYEERGKAVPKPTGKKKRKGSGSPFIPDPLVAKAAAGDATADAEDAVAEVGQK